jgi:hypothetical protein
MTHDYALGHHHNGHHLRRAHRDNMHDDLPCREGPALVAYNYDAWASEGLILVNKRGMSKKGGPRARAGALPVFFLSGIETERNLHNGAQSTWRLTTSRSISPISLTPLPPFPATIPFPSLASWPHRW